MTPAPAILAAALILLPSGSSGRSEEDPRVRQPQAPRIVEDLAGRVEDRTGLPAGNPADPPEEYKAYCFALLTARTTSNEAFVNSVSAGVTYAHLFQQPEEHRGQVVRFQGRLKRIRKFSAPELIRSEVSWIYECALFDLRNYGAHPQFAVVTELPSGVPVAEEMDLPVSVYGYFFKRWRYLAGDGWRDAPLLIGRTLQVAPGAAIPGKNIPESFGRDLVIGALILLGVTIALIIGLSYWYRRGDRRLKSIVDISGRLELCPPKHDECGSPIDTSCVDSFEEVTGHERREH
jgi:hypothetical protein